MGYNSKYLESFELGLCTSAARAADLPVTLAYSNVLEFSIDVTVRSEAAAGLMNEDVLHAPHHFLLQHEDPHLE